MRIYGGWPTAAAGLAGTPEFDLSDASHYTDAFYEKGQWVYFRAVLLVSDARSFIGVGLGRFDGEEVSVGYLTAYRASYEREPFETEYFAPRTYGYDYICVRPSRGTLVSAQYRPWDESYAIGNLFDEDDGNFIHSDRSDISPDSCRRRVRFRTAPDRCSCAKCSA